MSFGSALREIGPESEKRDSYCPNIPNLPISRNRICSLIRYAADLTINRSCGALNRCKP